MFWMLLSCCNLPLPAANSKFQVFPTKVACILRAKRVTYKLYTFPSNENSNGVSHPTRMSHGSNEPDADESWRERAWAGYQCLGCKQTCQWSSVKAWASGPALAGGSCGNCDRRMFCDSSVAFLRLPRTAVATAVL